MDENTKTIYWMMLMEIESSLKENDVPRRLMIEDAYRHWNKQFGTKLAPRHVECSTLTQKKVDALYAEAEVIKNRIVHGTGDDSPNLDDMRACQDAFKLAARGRDMLDGIKKFKSGNASC